MNDQPSFDGRGLSGGSAKHLHLVWFSFKLHFRFFNKYANPSAPLQSWLSYCNLEPDTSSKKQMFNWSKGHVAIGMLHSSCCQVFGVK